jgi:hypothetical protein
MAKAEEPRSMGAGEAMWEGVKLGVSGFLSGMGQVWDAAKPFFDHGRSEAAAALFNANPYVMYQRTPQQEAQVEAPETTTLAQMEVEGTQKQQEVAQQREMGGNDGPEQSKGLER